MNFTKEQREGLARIANGLAIAFIIGAIVGITDLNWSHTEETKMTPFVFAVLGLTAAFVFLALYVNKNRAD